jgi:hypothetical protein
LAPVSSWDAGFRAASKVEVPKEMTKNFVERFNNLGYVGMEGSDVKEPVIVDPKGFKPDTRSPVGDERTPAPKKP